MKKEQVTGVILIAGSSTRFGQKRNKNLELLNGRHVFLYCLDVFVKNKNIDDIIIVLREGEKKLVSDILAKEKYLKSIELVIGGETRKDSVYNALKKTDADYVVIHDGARPLIKNKYIDESVLALNTYKGVTVGVRSKDTIKIADDKGVVISSTERINTWLIQTPQSFERKLLKELHEKYYDNDITDDCMLLEKAGYDVRIIESDYTNIKITTIEDIEICEALFKDNY